jgi:hypothetical protein
VVGETPCGVVGRDEHRDTALAPDEATSLEVVEVLADGDGGDVGDTGELGDGDATGDDDGLEKGELTSTHGVHAPLPIARDPDASSSEALRTTVEGHVSSQVGLLSFIRKLLSL